MLTGERPFTGATDVATQMNVVNGRRRRIEDLAPQTPALLVEIANRLLQTVPERRHPDARALAVELGRFHVRPADAFALGEIARRGMSEREGGAEQRTTIDLPRTRST